MDGYPVLAELHVEYVSRTGGFGNGRESDIYSSIRESEVRAALEKYVGGDGSICNILCGPDLFGLAGLSVTTEFPPLEQREKPGNPARAPSGPLQGHAAHQWAEPRIDAALLRNHAPSELAVDDMSRISPTWRALGQVGLVYLAVGGSAVIAQDTQPGRATLAEMIAFARLASVPCQRLAPDADSFHALALRRLIKPPISEEEIAAKEKDTKRLRARLGLSRWCKRYAAVMEQARILVQVLRRSPRD